MTMLAVLLACGSVAAELEDRIVAVVNSEIITMRELNQSFEPYAKGIQTTYKGNDLEGVLEYNKKIFLQRMIDQILIENEAKKAGKNFTTIKDEEVMAVIMDIDRKSVV
jgi:peptidyl-prolyl cis-trans isomerase SurA